MSRISVLASFAILVFSTPATAACPSMSLPELVAMLRPQPVDRNMTRELTPITLKEVVEQAEIVVEGTVHPIKTYLSSDQCLLLTDYTVVPQAIIAGSIPLAAAPGAQPFVFTQVGGELTIDGVKVTVRDQQLPPLASGQRLILFLTRSSRDKSKYELVRTVRGAFEVDGDGRVTPMVKVTPDHDAAMSAQRDAFVHQVQSLRQRKGR